MKLFKYLLPWIIGLNVLFNVNSEDVEEKAREKFGLEIVLEENVTTPNTTQLETENYCLSSEGNLIVQGTKTPDVEKERISEIMNLWKNKEITNYPQLIGSGNQLSEDSKLALLCTIGSVFHRNHYDKTLTNNPLLPQTYFFKNLFNTIVPGLGACKQESSHIERTGKDLGLTIAVVNTRGNLSQGGHAIDILKLPDKNAIIDSSTLTRGNTKNVEEILAKYHKDMNLLMFQHFFFERNALQYKLITEDGKKFLDAIGYNRKQDSQNKIKLSLEEGLSELKINYEGVTVNIDKIQFANPMIDFLLLQGGYEFGIKMPNAELISRINCIYGLPLQKSRDPCLFGTLFNSKFNTNNQNGLNISFDFNYLDAGVPKCRLIWDMLGNVEISYTQRKRDLLITPYISLLSSVDIRKLDTFSYFLGVEEIIGGAKIEYNSGNKLFLLNPYMSWKEWEDTIGIEGKVADKNWELKVDGSQIISTYPFSPNESEFQIGATIKMRDWKLEGTYGLNQINYDREKSITNSFQLEGEIKL